MVACVVPHMLINVVVVFVVFFNTHATTVILILDTKQNLYSSLIRDSTEFLSGFAIL